MSQKKLNRTDVAVLKAHLNPQYLIEHTYIFEGGNGSHIAQKFKDYWKIWIEPDLKILIEYAERRANERSGN